MKQVSTSGLPVFSILLESLTFIRRNLVSILSRTWFLALIGCTIFYFAFNEYMTELGDFLAAPTEADASVALGLVSASVLLLLFVNTLAVATITDLALGKRRKFEPFSIRIGHQEWRLYAASLRLLLLLTILVATAYFVILGMKTARLGYIAQYALETGIVVILATIALRLGFLLPAVAMAEARGVILRKSWKLSGGNFLPLILFAIAVVLPGLLMELLGEFVARATQQFPTLYINSSLQDNIHALRMMAPVFSILFCLPIMLTTLLYAIVSATIYRTLITPHYRTD